MDIAIHQPIFLPWPGFFFKAMKAQCMVLLDRVQFPRGRGWMNRNRLKSPHGELWLTVPVHKKGRGLQLIDSVEVFDRTNWPRKHLSSIQHNYANAPYLKDYLPALERIYTSGHRKLTSLNLELIRLFWQALDLKTDLVLQSDLGIKGKGTKLIANICRHLQAAGYVTFPIAEKYLDLEMMKQFGIRTRLVQFHPPVYPQLWGDFISNLSILDVLLNCGPKSKEFILRT